jgi:RecB family endonuclease NucS
MPVYQVTKEDFEPLHRTSFEAEKLRERDDIQKRLRDRPDILEDGLYILAEEFGNWEESNRRIDLLP